MIKRLFILFLFVAMSSSAMAQDAEKTSKFAELQNRLQNLKAGETAEDVLKEYAGETKKPAGSIVMAMPIPGVKDLSGCSYDAFNVTFLCDPKWPVNEDEGIVVYTISTSPAVSLSITKVGDSVKVLEQINKDDLALTDQYADGFVLQDAELKGRKAKMVKGFSKSAPNVRYLDYYILNNGTLYSVLFAVDPQESWDNYKFLIKSIADSLDFK